MSETYWNWPSYPTREVKNRCCAVTTYPGLEGKQLTFTFSLIALSYAGTLVTDDYPARGNEFNGKINWVQVDLEPADHSHMIDTDHMAHVRLTKQ